MLFLPNIGKSIPQKIQKKNSKQIQKIGKTSFWLHFYPNRARKGKIEKKKFYSGYQFYPTQAREFPKKNQKNSEKIQKN